MPSCQATKLPISELENARGSVRGRAACTHALYFSFVIIWLKPFNALTSGEFGKFLKIGFPLFKEGAFSFLRFFGEVIKQGGISGQLL